MSSPSAPSAQDWIQRLQLIPHPEGGYYRRIYQSKHSFNCPQGERPLASAIHYLLEQRDFSAWHRIKSDETWFYHQGDALQINEILPSGQLIQHILGPEQQLAVTITAGHWFSAQSPARQSPMGFSLVSCCVNPGFHFDDFELASAEELVSLYPQHRDIICALCRA